MSFFFRHDITGRKKRSILRRNWNDEMMEDEMADGVLIDARNNDEL